MRLLRRGKSFSGDITFVYASLSVALVVLLSYIAYQMNSRVLEERIRQDLLQGVDQAVHRINAEIDERAREVQTLTLSPAMREAALRGTRRTEALGLQRAEELEVAARSAERREGTPSAADRFLAELKESHPYIAEVFVTDRYGINAASSGPTGDLRQNDETWWQEAVAKRGYLNNLSYDRSGGGYTYSVALPILDDPRPPLGVVKAVFNLNAIQELVNSVHVGNGGYLVVISPKGKVISHPQSAYVFRDMSDVPDLAPVARRIASSLRGVADYDPADPSGPRGRWMVGYSRIMRPASLAPLNWTVAALVSRAEVTGPIVAVRDSAIIAGLVFILAAVPIVFAVSRRLSGPLADLAHRADRISQGDLDVSLAMPSSNEIGRLASALASMVDTLKAAHRRTLDINAGLERTVRERTEELRKKNRQIEAQNRKVMEASRLKSQFLANMSHELRTPLNAVLALSDILANEMSGPLNEEQAKQASLINRSGKSLLRLINDVLDLSKIEAGRMSVERKPMSLHALITLMTDTLRPLAEDKALALNVELDEHLPEFINADEHKLRQILVNLLGNGIKFTENGGVTLRASFKEDPASISFDIIDTGIGIAPEAMDHIFEEFRQADESTTRQYGGTGLGLTISRKMAELMGGTLTVASEFGAGSTFTLTVPYEAAPAVPASPTETLRRVRMQMLEPSLAGTGDDSATALNDHRPVVLVAEDEMDNLYIMKKYLNRLGCQVIFARDGNEVMDKARQYSPIAITLDLVLPKKSGWDVLTELKSDPKTRHIPVIIASVLDNRERGVCLGAYRYLVKPINETDLADTIDQIQWAQRKDVKRVLIIDDNIVDSDLLARLLVENKYEVLAASRGEEGIATAAREHPDLVMLDLSMPGMDGFQVMEGLKTHAETRDIPVIIYTAKDLSPDENLRLSRDACSVFLKNPLDPARMLGEIGRLLESLPAQVTPADPRGTRGQGAATLPVPDLGNWNAANDVAACGAQVRGAEGRAVILLVEDDPANQYTLEFLLRTEGFDVSVAQNGREALELIDSLRPDVVLMDMMMPEMGGHEATRTLRERPGIMHTPVIALTAAAMPGDREKALAAGCDDYISKPIDSSLLLDRIEYWLEHAERNAQSSAADNPPPAEDASAT